MIKLKETLLGVKVPRGLKEQVSTYCDRNGVKIKYFVTQALQDKLLEAAEDNYDNAIVDQRLKTQEFVGEAAMKKYLRERKTKN